MRAYRGRLAPSPTGYLHLGHARTFWVAWQRARATGGKLVFRNEDLDYQRCKPEFVNAMYKDLRWLGLDWDEGPDIPPQPGDPGVSGPFAPYSQSERRSFYLEAWRKLRDSGSIYPCTCSRKDLERALSAPHEEPLHGAPSHGAAPETTPGSELSVDVLPGTDDELPYPGTCREKLSTAKDFDSPAGVSWRFRVPDGEPISFQDGFFGQQQFVAGRDFADFLLWRRDDIPAYQLAVVVDDEAMQITEVVRGADLLKSTARQLLLIRALGYSTPAYFHCPLLRDENDVRLAKRHDSLSLRTLRELETDPAELRRKFAGEIAWDKNLLHPTFHKIAEEARRQGVSVLFTGPGSTGKMLAAEALATELHRTLYRVDLKELVNKYIGETEKELGRLFDAADASGAILFFDEADALFGKRSAVKDSHDRYLNIETGYLLQRMESHKSLVIFATNDDEDALDRSLLKRLHCIIEFPCQDGQLKQS